MHPDTASLQAKYFSIGSARSQWEIYSAHNQKPRPDHLRAGSAFL